MIEGGRYILMTAFSAALSLGIPFILHEYFSVSENVAVAVGLFIVFVVNFLTIKLFVFRSNGPVYKEILKFIGSSFLFRASEYVAFVGLNSLLNAYLISLTFVLVTSFVAKFLVYKRYIFLRADGLPKQGSA